MRHCFKISCLFFLLLFSSGLFSQGETNNWYFGNQAGLNFNTAPPTIETNGALNAPFAAASISDAAGNLLFYTNGVNVYNQNHAIMPNGTALAGVGVSDQNIIIIKKPASSTIYYIFTADPTGGFCYHEVDMSLVSGTGSVTAKNVVIAFPPNLITAFGKLTATRHCNGTDIWLVGRESYYSASQNTANVVANNSFRAYLITPTGINPGPVVSNPISYTFNNSWTWGFGVYTGAVKLSPSGKKIGVAARINSSYNINYTSFELFDFDNTTGVVSNSCVITPTSPVFYDLSIGVEFSPDGTKLYGSAWHGANLTNTIQVYQWDMCAGSNTAIAASQFTVYNLPVAVNIPGSYNMVGALQVASDGKIYLARNGASAIDVIDNPNALGSACNFIVGGQSVSPKTSTSVLPNFMSSYLKPQPSPFTYTVSNSYGCQAALFNTTYTPGITTVGCMAAGYSLTSLQWNFNDPASGTLNTSTVPNPTHAFTSTGTYTVKLVLYFSCGGGTDTLTQVVNVNQPCISVSSNSITCSSLGSATVTGLIGTGPYSYTWMPTNQTNSVATNLGPGTYTIKVFDSGNNSTYSATTVFTSLIPLTGNLNSSSSITCNGASTGTANFTGLSGGSGSENYSWYNATTTLSVPNPTTLSAGLWLVTITDALTGCSLNQSFIITQPPAMNLTLASSTPTTCAGTSAIVSGTATTGGTPSLLSPAYTYSWVGGPATHSKVVSQNIPGNAIYTLTCRDSINCMISKTVAVNFIPNPVLSLSNVYICPLQTGVLNVSGATSYTWSTGANGNILSVNPVVNTPYSVIGSALGCTSSIGASVILKQVPVVNLLSNSPVCNGKNLNLSGYGGVSYSWSGPSGYNSNLQFPVINSASPLDSGPYTATITAANGCTASAFTTLTVHPTPIISALGSTICINQPLNLNANSFSAITYTWTGPSNYSSTSQNPSILSPSVNSSGNYTVKVTSAQSCTNSAVVNVTVTAMSQPIITSNSPLCLGTNLTLNGSGGDTYSWSGPSAFNSVLQNPFINNVVMSQGGLYNLQVSRGPCINSISHFVTVNALPSFTISSNIPCDSDPLNLYSTPLVNVIRIWTGPLFNSSLTDPIIPVSSFNNSGIYSLKIIDNNSCQNTQTLAVTVNPNPTLSTVSKTVCLNQSATLEITGAATYEWNGPGSYQYTGASAYIASATNPAQAIYTVIGTAANSCTSITTASLNTWALPLPALSVSPRNTICLNKTIKMDGFGGTKYKWFGPDNFTQTGKTLTLTLNSILYIGTYSLEVTDEKGCVSFTTTQLNISPLPNGSLVGSLMDACVPFSSDFNFYSTASSSSLVTAQWQINEESPIKTKSFSRSFKVPGDYHIKGSFTDTITGCVNTATFMVYARPIPVADFTYTATDLIEGREEVLFENTSQGEELSKWTWYFIKNEGKISEQKNTSYHFKEAGKYPVAMIVQNTWGCRDTIVKEVFVKPDFNVFVPNVFTPNGDDDNEVFLPVTVGVSKFEIFIFNRWGKLLFQSNDMSRGWDGIFNGQPCQDGIYIWKVKVSSINGETKSMEGHLTLYR